MAQPSRVVQLALRGGELFFTFTCSACGEPILDAEEALLGARKGREKAHDELLVQISATPFCSLFDEQTDARGSVIVARAR